MISIQLAFDIIVISLTLQEWKLRPIVVFLRNIFS